jgi:hypothetical protein
MPLSIGVALPTLDLLWIASLASDDDYDNEELAPRSPLASTKGVASASVCDAADVRHDEEAPVELCGGLSATADVLGDDEGWMQVGRGSCTGREPSSSLQKEGLERSLAFKYWDRGRYFGA